MKIMGYYRSNEKFAMTGTRNGAGFIVCVGSGTDYWAVAHSAEAFIGNAPSGSGSGEISVHIERHGSNSSKFFFTSMIELDNIISLRILPLMKTFFIKKIIILFHFNIFLTGKFFCTFAAKKYVLGIHHHFPCQRNRVFYMPNGTNGTCLQVVTSHNRCVHFVLPFMIKYCTTTRIEER